MGIRNKQTTEKRWKDSTQGVAVTSEAYLGCSEELVDAPTPDKQTARALILVAAKTAKRVVACHRLVLVCRVTLQSKILKSIPLSQVPLPRACRPVYIVLCTYLRTTVLFDQIHRDSP